MSKYNKKIETLKKKRYEYTPTESLNKTLGNLGGGGKIPLEMSIEEYIKRIKYRESIGEIKNLVIREFPEHWYIMFDDLILGDLGEPLIIRKGKEIILDTPEKLVEHYKKSEKIQIITIFNELKDKPLEVFFICKGDFLYRENGHKIIWYDFMDNDGKVYTIELNEINRLEFDDDIKVFDTVVFSNNDDMLGIKWQKSEK